MPNFLQDRKVPIFFGRFELFCLFVACSWHESESYSVMLFLLMYGPACLKFSEITNRQYLWKGFSDFVDFLHAVVCILLGIHWSYKKMLLWVDTVRYRIPANQIVRCFKLNEVPSWLSANHWSYEKYAILSYGPNNFLANQFAEFSTFDLFDLLILKVIANSWFWT